MNLPVLQPVSALTPATGAPPVEGTPPAARPWIGPHGEVMRRLELHITYTCPERCVFCSEEHRMQQFNPYPVTFARVATVLREHARRGVDSLHLTGGEPTIHPEFIEILRLAKKLGMRTSVGTIGTMLAREDFARRALPYLDEALFSLHGPDAATHDALTGRPGSFAQVTRAIALAREIAPGFQAHVNTVVVRANVEALPDTVALAERLGADLVIVSNMTPEGLGLDRYAELAVPLETLAWVLPRVPPASTGMIVRFFGVPMCLLREFRGLSNDLHWDPRVTVEWASAPGKVVLDEFYNWVPNRKRVHVAECTHCTQRGVCMGVFDRYAELFPTDALRPVLHAHAVTPERPTNQQASAHRDPRRNVEINVGKSCNYKCVFCLDGMPTKEDKKYIDFEDMKAELRLWRAQGHLSVGFLGGEPTTYPKIVESVAYAHEIGFTRVALATNAIMLRRDAFLDALLAAGLTRTTISMHGHTLELEDRLTGVPGGFHKKVAAIRNLKARQALGYLPDGVSVNIVLNGWNYRQLLPMMKFFYEDLGLDDLRVNFVRPEGYAEGNADLVPTFTDAVPYLIKAIALNETHFRKVFGFGGFPMCVLPKTLLESAPLLRRNMGDIFRDLSTDCSIAKQGPDEIDGVAVAEGGRARFNWQDRKRFDLKHHIEACRTCEFADPCEGVWRGYLEIYGEGEFAPLARAGGEVVRAPRLRKPPVPRAPERRNPYPRRLVVLLPQTT